MLWQKAEDLRVREEALLRREEAVRQREEKLQRVSCATSQMSALR